MVEIEVWKHGAVAAKAKVDDAFAHLGENRWRLHSAGYAHRSSCRRGNQTEHYLHREVMGNPKGLTVDHRNGDRLDCRQKNLRVTDKIGNGQNRQGAQMNSGTGVRGVHIIRSSGKYCAQVKRYGKAYHVGNFDNLADAERAVIAKRQEFEFLTGAESPAASPAAS